MFKLCGEAEDSVARVGLEMEMTIDNGVLKPLMDVLEIDIPSIQKLKKQLGNRALDMDSAKAR